MYAANPLCWCETSEIVKLAPFQVRQSEMTITAVCVLFAAACIIENEDVVRKRLTDVSL